MAPDRELECLDFLVVAGISGALGLFGVSTCIMVFSDW